MECGEGLAASHAFGLQFAGDDGGEQHPMVTKIYYEVSNDAIGVSNELRRLNAQGCWSAATAVSIGASALPIGTEADAFNDCMPSACGNATTEKHVVAFGSAAAVCIGKGDQGTTKAWKPNACAVHGDLANGVDGLGNNSLPMYSPGNVWKRPSVVSLPLEEELGGLSMDGDTVNLDEGELHNDSQKFESSLVGRMFGTRFSWEVHGLLWDKFWDWIVGILPSLPLPLRALSHQSGSARGS